MSVHRQLVERQAAFDYSTESVKLVGKILTLQDEFHQLVSILPEVAGNDVSFESNSRLEELGYSTEASEGKSLLSRIWDGIKRIAASIKQFIARLLSMRKHYLAQNTLGVERLRHYIKTLDMSSKPDGEIQIANSLLPDNPADAHNKLGLLRGCLTKGMNKRNDAIVKLSGMNLSDITKANVDEKIHSLVDRSADIVSVRSDHRALSFWFLVEKMEFEVGKGNGGVRQATKQSPASLILMNSLLKDYDELVKDDNSFSDSIRKHTDDTDKVIKMLQALMDGWERDHHDKNHNDMDVYLAESNEIADKVKAVGQMMACVNRMQRLTHIHAFNHLYDDIITILQRSLGCYKMKKHEVDQNDLKSAREGDHEYR